MITLAPRKPSHAIRLRHNDPEMPLTTKQWRFVDEYLLDMNATAAARRAGYGERSAAQNGQRANVAAAIEAPLAAQRI